MLTKTFHLAGALSLAATLVGGTAALAQTGGTVAFLMPDQGSTRYEEHDFPGFKAEMEKLCPDCQLIYQNANADVALQQQQFNSVLTQGATVIVLDPVELGRRGLARRAGAEPGGEGHRLRPADPRQAGGFLRVLRQSGDRQGDLREPRPASRGGRRRQGQGRRAADQRLADRRGRGPDPRRRA